MMMKNKEFITSLPAADHGTGPPAAADTGPPALFDPTLFKANKEVNKTAQ
jgi:hypothetical protein